MKIWILTTEYPPHFGGGIGTYVENVSNMYARSGDKVKVIVRDNISGTEIKENGNLSIHRFVLNNDGPYTMYMGEIQSMAYQYYEYVCKLLDSGEKPDVIEIQEYNAIGYFIFQKKFLDKNFLKDVPVVVHLHTPQFALFDINKFLNYKFPDYWIGQMERFCIKAADAILCPSEFLKNKLKDINKDVEIKVINLPFASEPEDKELSKIEKDDKLFVYFGRKEYRKGVKQLVETFERLWKEGYDCKLKLIGGDVKFFPKNEFLGEMLENKYKKRVEQGLLIFQDNTPPTILKKDIMKARAIIIPSLYENFPNTCIMSMWLGKPVIVSKQGGQAEMVAEDGINGYIFDYDVKDDFYNKVKLVLNEKNDKLNKIGENASKRIYELCNMDKNLKMRKEFFKNVIKEYSLKPRKNTYPFLNDTSDYNTKISKNSNELLSVVIPYYNMGEFIDETVESIRKSLYKNKEIIIVNDGSSDEKSIEQLEKYRNSKDVTILDIPNGGLANARNVGANIAKGTYLAFLDADDLVEQTFYSKGIDILNRYNNVSYVFSYVKYFGANSDAWTTFDTQLPYLLCHNMLNANALIRKEDFIKYGQNRVEMEFGMEDYDMWLSLAENSCFGVCIPEFLSLYRVRKNSMARGFNKNNLLYLMEIITKNHSKLYKQYGAELYNIVNANGASYLYNNPSFIPPEFNMVGKISTRNKTSVKDVLWRYAIWRGFIKFLQKTGIMKVLKTITGTNNK